MVADGMSEGDEILSLADLQHQYAVLKQLLAARNRPKGRDLSCPVALSLALRRPLISALCDDPLSQAHLRCVAEGGVQSSHCLSLCGGGGDAGDDVDEAAQGRRPSRPRRDPEQLLRPIRLAGLTLFSLQGALFGARRGELLGGDERDQGGAGGEHPLRRHRRQAQERQLPLPPQALPPRPLSPASTSRSSAQPLF